VAGSPAAEKRRPPSRPHLEELAELPTPCLVVDRDALERNLRTAADYFTTGRVRLRPHFKAHKCTTLLRCQLEAGGCSGVTCATAAEALVLARAGFTDVLIANEVVDRHALDLLAEAAKRTRVTVAVDCLRHVELLADAAREAAFDVAVLIEIDVGLHRCGLAPGSDELLPVAAAIDAAPGLTFVGLQGYEGHAVFVLEREERGRLVGEAAEALRSERRRLEEVGFGCRVVSGGGTGTYDLAEDVGVLDEVQAGSYALMDARYAGVDLPFEPALYCLTTVISRRGATAVLDAGLKSLSREYGLPVCTADGVECLDLSDEHTQVTVTDAADLPVGARVALIPGHVDPTVNLHDVLFVVDGVRRISAWPVDGRRSTGAAR
jgi:D-serine deaminase-like pyridoxal phosphate-dependent protein